VPRIEVPPTSQGASLTPRPKYYFPPSAVRLDLLKPSAARRTLCEWKGQALYHDVFTARARIWSYPAPTPAFAPIKDYLCFYASSNTKGEGWSCFGACEALQTLQPSADVHASRRRPGRAAGGRLLRQLDHARDYRRRQGLQGRRGHVGLVRQGAGTWGW
jgi:hypothetical protein